VSGFRIEALDAAVDTADFHCGTVQLDDYIGRYALQDVRRGLARAFVALPVGDATRIAGYYTLSAASVSASSLPDALRRKLPRYPVPVALLGRLAVDQAFQGQGLGSILLADACIKVARASEVLAVAGLIVDAKDESSAMFYRHFGFVPLPGEPQRLLLQRKAFPTDINSLGTT
jgi:GNAT superfamily N-acetyltransferase